MANDKTYAVKTFIKAGLPDKGTFTAKAELHSIGNQHPYFSIRGDLREGNRWVAGGCMHDEVEQFFPELAPLVRWHLTSTDGPMHYLANAEYHAGFCVGMENARNLEYLKSTIVYGALESDAEVNLETLTDVELQSFLVARFPALMAKWREDMAALFGDNLPELPEAKPLTIPAPKKPLAERQADLKAKRRQDVVDQCDQTIRKATENRDVMLWLMDHDIPTDNAIYYDHTKILTFGWRDKVTDDFASKLLDVASEFPFDYEIKAQARSYSSR